MSTVIVEFDKDTIPSYIPFMSPEQCRAGRAWLGWSMDDLAGRANVSSSTIRDFEAHRRQPHKNRLTQIRQALEVEGIIFMFNQEGVPTGIGGKAPVSQVGAPKVERKFNVRAKA